MKKEKVETSKPKKVIEKVKESVKKKKTEKLKKPKINGGARPGAGRKAGGLNKDTKKKRLAMKIFKNRVRKSVDRLFNAQMSLAEGCSFLFKIKKDSKGKNQKPEIVKDENEIINYLDGEYDEDKSVYYYISTERPSNMAIDSMLDRTFGKAKQSVDHGGEVTINHAGEASKRLLDKYR